MSPYGEPTRRHVVIWRAIRYFVVQRLAVIKGRNEFTLVPWRPELLKMRGKEIDISVRDRTIMMALARGRIRDLGLSR